MGTHVTQDGQRAKADSASPTASTNNEAFLSANDAGKEGNKISSTTPTEDKTEVIDEFRVNCLMNARYHHSRERYLISWHRWIMFFVIVIGTASVSDLVKDVSYLNELIDQNTAKAIFGAMSAFLGALDLVFDFSTRASAHSVLKSRYYNLLSSFIDNQITLTKANAQLAEISADEEPAFYALMNLSWNAAQESVYGDDADSYKIGFFKRLLKNVFTFEGTKFELETRNRSQLYNNPL